MDDTLGMNAWAVTVNVGGGPGGGRARTEAMTAWALQALHERQPAVVFAQEVPSDGWLQVWEDAGYAVTLGHDRGWRIRSALITAPGLRIEPLTPEDLPNLQYHGNYVAAARCLDAQGGPVILASVHASPQPADPGKYGWQGQLPSPRVGGDDRRYAASTLWDSDLLLASLRDLAAGGSAVVAAGDFNEARAFDLDPAGERLGSWGDEYFRRVAEYQLKDWLMDRWHEERPTRAHLQLDRVITNDAGERLLPGAPEPFVDPAWTVAGTFPAELSDHAPVWFPLQLSS